MTRRVFYSFHFDNDHWRTHQVRHMGAIAGNPTATPNQWEEVKRNGDRAIRNWIDKSLEGRSCTIVLVGAQTANRKWINYEIEQSYKLGMGLFGVRVHRLLDANSQSSIAGANPFDYVRDNGKPLSMIVPLYDPPGPTSRDAYGYIADHVSDWIEKALR